MMGASERQSLVAKVGEWAEKRVTAIWTNLQTNHLWQRMLKNTLATTIAVILALIPAVVAVFGTYHNCIWAPWQKIRCNGNELLV